MTSSTTRSSFDEKGSAGFELIRLLFLRVSEPSPSPVFSIVTVPERSSPGIRSETSRIV